jgi:hypothetical protein
LAEKKIGEPDPNFAVNLVGLRAVAFKDDLIYVGDNDGLLHCLDLKLDEVRTIVDNTDSVSCISVHPTEPLLVAGGGNGAIHVYSLSPRPLNSEKAKQLFHQPVTSVIFASSGVIAAASGQGIQFLTYSEFEVFSVYESPEPILSLAVIERANLIAAGGCDRSITLFRCDNGRVFRRYLLSPVAYPLAIACHSSGLVICAAMSNSEIFMIDAMTGDVFQGFDSRAGIVTALGFHDGDLIFSSLSGFFIRWTLSTELRDILEKKPASILDLLAPDQEPPSPVPPGSVIGGEAMPDWVYREVKVTAVEVQEPVVEEVEEEKGVEEDFNQDRPPLDDVEKKVEEFVRQSFVKRRKAEENLNGEEELIELKLPRERPRRVPIKIPVIEPVDKDVFDAMTTGPVFDVDNERRDDSVDEEKICASVCEDVAKPDRGPEKEDGVSVDNSELKKEEEEKNEEPKDSDEKPPEAEEIERKEEDVKDDKGKECVDAEDQEKTVDVKDDAPEEAVVEKVDPSEDREIEELKNDAGEGELCSEEVKKDDGPEPLVSVECVEDVRPEDNAEKESEADLLRPEEVVVADGQELVPLVEQASPEETPLVSNVVQQTEECVCPEECAEAPEEKEHVLAAKIRQTADTLRQIFAKVKVLLAQEPKEAEEIALHARLRSLIENLEPERKQKEEKRANVRDFISKLKENIRQSEQKLQEARGRVERLSTIFD